jgi:hypothetical protein
MAVQYFQKYMNGHKLQHFPFQGPPNKPSGNPDHQSASKFGSNAQDGFLILPKLGRATAIRTVRMLKYLYSCKDPTYI